MGVILGDLTREAHDMSCNWWNWYPTLAVLAPSGIIDAEQLERMRYNGGGAEVTAEEARRIANYIAGKVLSRMQAKDEVKLDGHISDQPRWVGPLAEQPASDECLYGASRMWFEAFIAFCRECGGFAVY
jgi:hypothetical protein